MREISFVSLVAYGPKVSLSALAMEGLQLLKPGRVVPNNLICIYLTYIYLLIYLFKRDIKRPKVCVIECHKERRQR